MFAFTEKLNKVSTAFRVTSAALAALTLASLTQIAPVSAASGSSTANAAGVVRAGCGTLSATIGARTLAPAAGQDKTVYSLKAVDINGLSMHIQGTHIVTDVALDTFVVSNFDVDGTNLYSTVTPMFSGVFTEDLLVRFDGVSRIRLVRKGLPGRMEIQLDDCDHDRTLSMRPEPRNPAAVDIVYVLGELVGYQLTIVDPVNGTMLHFDGPVGAKAQGLELSEPDLALKATLVSWNEDMAVWNVPAGAGIVTDLD